MPRALIFKKYTLVALSVAILLSALPFTAFALIDDNPPPIVDDDPNTLDNPLNVNTFPALLSKLLDAAIAIGIPIAVFFIVLAGFKLVWAQGNPKKLEEARRNLLNTLIGIAIFVGASIIVKIIIATLCSLGVQGVGSC